MSALFRFTVAADPAAYDAIKALAARDGVDPGQAAQRLFESALGAVPSVPPPAADREATHDRIVLAWLVRRRDREGNVSAFVRDIAATTGLSRFDAGRALARMVEDGRLDQIEPARPERPGVWMITRAGQ